MYVGRSYLAVTEIVLVLPTSALFKNVFKAANSLSPNDPAGIMSSPE
jgi:hypothetical protein